MKVQVRVDDALTTLQKNLEAHVVELGEAMTGWVHKVNLAITKLANAVTRDGVKAEAAEVWHLFCSKPVDHRLNYSRYITAFEQARKADQKLIEIDVQECDEIFGDNFAWRIQSKTSNSAYSIRR